MIRTIRVDHTKFFQVPIKTHSSPSSCGHLGQRFSYLNEWVLIDTCKQLVWSTRKGRNISIQILCLILGSGLVRFCRWIEYKGCYCSSGLVFFINSNSYILIFSSFLPTMYLWVKRSGQNVFNQGNGLWKNGYWGFQEKNRFLLRKSQVTPF
jgi:hypothetical protein